jgi:sulfur carrier protein
MAFVSTTWTLQINGEPHSVPPVTNVRELLAFLGIGEERVAVELNRNIVRRAEWESTVVSDRDRVEIVQFVGGG